MTAVRNFHCIKLDWTILTVTAVRNFHCIKLDWTILTLTAVRNFHCIKLDWKILTMTAVRNFHCIKLDWTIFNYCTLININQHIVTLLGYTNQVKVVPHAEKVVWLKYIQVGWFQHNNWLFWNCLVPYICNVTRYEFSCFF